MLVTEVQSQLQPVAPAAQLTRVARSAASSGRWKGGNEIESLKKREITTRRMAKEEQKQEQLLRFEAVLWWLARAWPAISPEVKAGSILRWWSYLTHFRDELPDSTFIDLFWLKDL